MKTSQATTAAFLALLTLGGVAQAQTAQTTPPTTTDAAITLPTSRLAAASAIRSTATFSIMNREGKPTPFFGVVVSLQRPTNGATERIRIDATPLAGQAKATSFYLSDGKTQYEYNSLQGKYRSQEALKPDQRPFSQLASMAGLSLLRTPGSVSTGVKRTMERGTLNDKPAIIVTDSETPRPKSVAWIRTWYDATSGLPLRQVEGSTTLEDKVEHPNLVLDFTGWTFDEPLPPTTFAWSVPKDAVEDKGPTLLAKGTAAPDFTAYTVEGKPVKLSDYKGKIVILDFWATWCGPCQQSMPHLEKVYQQVKGQDVVVLAVCVWDQKAEYNKWVAAKKGTYTFLTVFDPAGRADNNIAKSQYKVEGIPTQYVIGKDGKIVAGTIGFNEKGRFLETALSQLGVTLPKTSQTASK